MNNLLLEDEQIKAYFCKLYGGWVRRKNYFSDILGWWDWVKKKIKFYFQKKSKERVYSERRRYGGLQSSLATLYAFRNMHFDVSEEITY